MVKFAIDEINGMWVGQVTVDTLGLMMFVNADSYDDAYCACAAYVMAQGAENIRRGYEPLLI